MFFAFWYFLLALFLFTYHNFLLLFIPHHAHSPFRQLLPHEDGGVDVVEHPSEHGLLGEQVAHSLEQRPHDHLEEAGLVLAEHGLVVQVLHEGRLRDAQQPLARVLVGELADAQPRPALADLKVLGGAREVAGVHEEGGQQLGVGAALEALGRLGLVLKGGDEGEVLLDVRGQHVGDGQLAEVQELLLLLALQEVVAGLQQDLERRADVVVLEGLRK